MNNNVQSHDQGQSKLYRTINASSGPHRLRHDKIIKSLFNKNNHGVLTQEKDHIIRNTSSKKKKCLYVK